MIDYELEKDYRNRRTKDDKDEKIVSEFADEYFYPQFADKWERNTDISTQIKGLDVTVTGSTGSIYTIDEKASTHWIGKKLQTFSQELSFVNKFGKIQNGWFLDTNCINDYFVEIWIDDVSSSEKILNDWHDITDATIVLLKKEDMYQRLRNDNIHGEQCLKICQDLRDKESNKSESDYYNQYKLCVQPKNKRERAGNILFSRNVLVNELSIFAVRIKNKELHIIVDKR